ncbi:hypothetical protein [Hahella sp. CCB-MM4]|uniref:hypothetical protein n=1 Tax=Hahella sp. (strain CCB-MM4) TaxID=1926491 RepID=UPI00113FD81A|nr:hypothetical protein [Hahella sp. CCB-MM4]
MEKITPKSVKPLNQDELEVLSTERLLAYLRRLQKCEESIELSDWQLNEVSTISGIVFKSSEEWKTQYNLVKVVLAKRPNVD